MPEFIEPKRDVTHISIDLETTGLEMTKHGIVQIGAWATGDTQEAFKSYFVLDVNPHFANRYEPGRRQEVAIDPKALEVNGFTRERIEAAVPLWKGVELFYAWLEKFKLTERVPVGQNTPFDYGWLQYDFRRMGYDTKVFRKAQELYSLTYLRFGKAMSLDAAAEACGYENRDAHDALADAYTTSRVFHKIRKDYRGLLPSVVA